MDPTPTLRITTLDEEPALAAAMWRMRLWPTFMTQDPVSDLYYEHVEERFADCCLLLLDGDAPIGRAFFVPVALDAAALPDRGWDAAIEGGVAAREAGATPPTASALEISVAPERRSEGHSRRLLDAMRTAVATRGCTDLFAPVRPSGKAAHPRQSMESYLARVGTDGLLADPWLRAHQRAGGAVVRVAPSSMTIAGSLDSWREWTGLPFDADGPTLVPDALVPVEVDLDADRAVYVEPNVWVRHRLT
jgi:GNAT superfamily N-acetyltransferase